MICLQCLVCAFLIILVVGNVGIILLDSYHLAVSFKAVDKFRYPYLHYMIMIGFILVFTVSATLSLFLVYRKRELFVQCRLLMLIVQFIVFMTLGVWICNLSSWIGIAICLFG